MSRGPYRLEVLHRVLGRVRVGVSPCEPPTLRRLSSEVLRVRGVTGAEPGATGTNLVIRYRPSEILEDALLMRLALAYSAHAGYPPVQLIKERRAERLDRAAVVAGATGGAASLLDALIPGSGVAGLAGWGAALLTLATVGRSIAGDLASGRPRPEGLSILYLLDRLDGPGRASGALLTWLLYNGKPLVDRLRGKHAGGVELHPISLSHGVGDDREGRHMEIVTRPLRDRGASAGELLTPATLATAVLGYLTFSLKQGWSGQRTG